MAADDVGEAHEDVGDGALADAFLLVELLYDAVAGDGLAVAGDGLVLAEGLECRLGFFLQFVLHIQEISFKRLSGCQNADVQRLCNLFEVDIG